VVQWQLANKLPETGGPAGCPAPGHSSQTWQQESGAVGQGLPAPTAGPAFGSLPCTLHTGSVPPPAPGVTTHSPGHPEAPLLYQLKVGEGMGAGERQCEGRDWMWLGARGGWR